MQSGAPLQDKFKRLAMPMIATLCLVYLGYHTIQGNRGLKAWVSLNDRLIEAKQRHANTKGKHDWLEHKVSLLAPGNADADMLDEAMRLNLHLGQKDEIVIRYKSPLPVN